MKKSHFIIGGILIALVFIHYFHTPEKPEITEENINFPFYSAEYRPDLVKLWNAIVRDRSFANESAVLLQLNQFVDKDGMIRCTQIYFTATVNGEQHVYEVYAYPGENVIIKDQKLDLPLQGAHPLDILQEVTKVDFVDLAPGDCNTTLKTFKHNRAMTYNKTQGNLYVISDGSLRPLEEVSFSHDTCWYTIEIAPEVEQSEMDTTKKGILNRFIVFTEQDIAFSNHVVYV
jgi:hypothetical protein